MMRSFMSSTLSSHFGITWSRKLIRLGHVPHVGLDEKLVKICCRGNRSGSDLFGALLEIVRVHHIGFLRPS
jgi:hypothetical protein